MRLAFISFPYASDPNGNTNVVKNICRWIADNEPDTIPVAPHLALSFMDEKDRVVVMAMCVELLAGCDALYVYGTHISEGMEIEIHAAHNLGIPVTNRKIPEGCK